MPLKLVPPREGRSKNYRIRGTYLGVRLDRTAETPDKSKARALLNGWRRQIERGEISGREELTFAAAALSYGKAGGEERFMKPVVDYFGRKTIAAAIAQADVDAAAVAVYPDASPATRNRQFYTPLCAILRHAGITTVIRRPKGAQGNARRIFLRPEQSDRLVQATAEEDEELAIFFTLLCYTGLRLSEGLRLRCADLVLSEGHAFIGCTKNGEPRSVHLPPRVVMALSDHPKGLERPGRVFRWTKCGELYLQAERAYVRARVDHGGAPFHVLRHTYGAWMTRAGADLVGTGAWKSPNAARVYQHFETSAEAKKASLLPGAVRSTWNK